MRDRVQTDINEFTNIIIPITLIKNYLDCISVQIMSPSESCNINNISLCAPECRRIVLNDATLSNALIVHEKGLHCSFFLDYKLSQSGQGAGMPIFPQLDIYCPTCHKHKITKTVTSLGGVTKTKNSTTVGRNQTKTSYNLNNIKTKNIKTDKIIKLLPLRNTQE